MFVKTLCLLLVLAVAAYGLPYQYDNGGHVDPGFGRYPNQGFAPDAGFGNGHGQGGLPSQGGFGPDSGFGHGHGHGQGGQGHHNGPHDDASGFQLRSHRHGYQEHGY